MFEFLSIFKRTIKRPSRAAGASDFGRRFGWFIERNGQMIGELEYLHWVPQFWHEYRLVWRKEDEAVVGPDAWISARLVLRNRRYTDVVIEQFLTAPQQAEGVISIRSASVPEDRLHDDQA